MDAKQSQADQMKNYAYQCQSLFEGLLGDLLEQQPEDPYEFLIQKLKQAPKEERRELARRIHSQQSQAAYRPFDPNLLRPVDIPTKMGVLNTLKLVLASDSFQETAISALNELKADALDTGKCIQFQVFYDEPNLEIFVNQGWHTQEDFEKFVQSPAFGRFRSKWTGVLAQPPQDKMYTRRVL